MTVACAVLMCHAPIVIPEIAGARAASCADTTRAMRSTAAALLAHEPELVVLISPHTPRKRDSFGVCAAGQLHGSFARFGHDQLTFTFQGAEEAAVELARAARSARIETHTLAVQELDHGALVPLYFLREAGFSGPVLLVALPYPGTEAEVAFGQAIEQTARRRGERWAVLASGDMSHRLLPDAPAGFDPRGAQFDRAFVAELQRGDLRAAISLPRELIDAAAEDVVQSTAVAAGAVDFRMTGARLFHYEGPFGVGYCEALLCSERAAHPHPGERALLPPRELATLAHRAIAHHLAGEPFDPPELPAPWDAPRAVFVTLRSPEGELRGCIGRTEPQAASLAREICDCAVLAATRDPRMRPVSESELPSLSLEVSVLSPPEPATREMLDPQRYGVVVSHGHRRGVLLPNIESIEQVEQQLSIALRKAGLFGDGPYRIERFTVDKVSRGPDERA